MQIEEGVIPTPFFIIIYGAPGVGKSTFCSHAPDPIFLDIEAGTKKIDVKRVSGIDTYEDLTKLINLIISGEKLSKYKTIIIDTIDFLEQMIFDYVCKSKGKKTISDFSHGAGYRFVLDEWLDLLNKLSIIRSGEYPKNIILIAHEQIKRFDNPLCDSYDRYSLKLYDKASSFIIAKCDAVFFLSKSFHLSEDTNDKKRKIAKAIAGRVIYTEETPSIIAKNRYGLKSEIRIKDNIEEYEKFFQSLI